MDCQKISRNIHSHTGIILLDSEKCVFTREFSKKNVLNCSCKTQKNVLYYIRRKKEGSYEAKGD